MITCDKCGESKDRKKFYFDGRNPNNRKTTCIKCYKKITKTEKNTLEDPRRDQSTKRLNLVIYKRATSAGVSKDIYYGSKRPTFLQYNQLIYNHVLEEHGLDHKELNLLFILYPIIPFNRHDYIASRKMTAYNNSALFKRLLREGWIFKWKKNLFDFTDKGKKLMSDCHLWALGKKIIPDPITEDVMDLFRKIQNSRR